MQHHVANTFVQHLLVYFNFARRPRPNATPTPTPYNPKPNPNPLIGLKSARAVTRLLLVFRWRFSKTNRPADRPASTSQTAVVLHEFFCKSGLPQLSATRVTIHTCERVSQINTITNPSHADLIPRGPGPSTLTLVTKLAAGRVHQAP